jgi:predicted Ser/Thr protein kinase
MSELSGGKLPKESTDFLSSVGTQVQQRFVANRMILSYEEYLALFFKEPRLHARSAAQHLRDAMDFFGTEEIETPIGKLRRFKLFDGVGEGLGLAENVHGGDGRVAGQEEVQNAIYRQISNFVRAGRVNKLIMLHGPNGSAKSSIITALMRAVEEYSRRPEGIRYRFNWVFPSEKLVKGSIGFGGAPPAGAKFETFAHLEGEAIEARIQCELKDTPLFLIPRDERRRMLLEHTRAAERGSDGDDAFILSDYMLDGELCQKCRSIYSALLAHYNGDFLKVLRHVQVERFYVSRRYQTASATVEPQMSVDADARQVTADRSHGSLPPPLQNLAFYEPMGALVSGNRGLVEFSDLLKRPLEAYKYLLGTVETASVSLGLFLLQLDAVLIASSNEKHLSAFKEIPDFASFKARIELVRVPYLRRYSVEKQIYDSQLDRATVGKHIAPHTTRIVAMWAVLTRLKKPMVERYKGAVRSIIDDLSPNEKLQLYDSGKAPDRLSLQQANELRAQLPALYRESDAYPNYEGRAGASAREMKTILLNAAQNAQYKCLNPLAVIEELTELVKDKTVYEFLQQERMDDFHAHEEFVRVVEDDYLDIIDQEIRDSMGLVSETQYKDLFERYVQHVSSSLKGEKIRNRVTGEYEKPDEDLMAHTESILMSRGQDKRDFRRSLISSVGAFRLDHPDVEIDYSRIFPDLFRHLREHFFEERKKTIKRNKENFLRYLGDEKSSLLERDRHQVESMLTTMRDRYHYCEHCAKDAILFLMRKRYSD